MRFSLVKIVPPRTTCHHAFDTVIDTVESGLVSLGHSVEVSNVPIFRNGTTPIVFGANLIPDYFPGLVLPDNTIIYQLEQIGPGPFDRPEYYDLLRRHRVWEYSQTNQKALAERGIESVHVPIGWAGCLKRVDRSVKRDIDVLFYGAINPRRADILNRLSELRQIHVAIGVYGRALDLLLSRAKWVLNLHYYDANITESVRLMYLVGNGVPVISEFGHDWEDWTGSHVQFVSSPVDVGLVDRIANQKIDHYCQQTGAEFVKSKNIVDILEGALCKTS